MINVRCKLLSFVVATDQQNIGLGADWRKTVTADHVPVSGDDCRRCTISKDVEGGNHKDSIIRCPSEMMSPSCRMPWGKMQRSRFETASRSSAVGNNQGQSALCNAFTHISPGSPLCPLLHGKCPARERRNERNGNGAPTLWPGLDLHTAFDLHNNIMRVEVSSPSYR